MSLLNVYLIYSPPPFPLRFEGKCMYDVLSTLQPTMSCMSSQLASLFIGI